MKNIGKHELHQGDCLEVMRAMTANSADSIVTDPPYGLSFMGKDWDAMLPDPEVWAEALRVLKPGGHLLAFAGTRTQHRMAVAIEDAGFEIRDMIAWVYGSGFPKSQNVSKAIDKAAGAEREVVGSDTKARSTSGNSALPTVGGETVYKSWDITAPATDAAQQWDGWGTALKPALEPITVARKPLARGNTVAANVLAHGTGAINVDGCRVGCEGKPVFVNGVERNRNRSSYDTGGSNRTGEISTQGRFPANLIHSGCDEVVGLFPVTHGAGTFRSGSGAGNVFPARQDEGVEKQRPAIDSGGSTARFFKCCPMDEGDAARFFYCAKASKRDRDEGCEGLPIPGREVRGDGGAQHTKGVQLARNHHPTVKPTDLMRYLCRLVTPPGGVVLDPFMGSGSTGRGAVLEGFQFIGIDLSEEYFPISCARIQAAVDAPKQNDLFT